MNSSLFLRPISDRDLPLLRKIFEDTRPDIKDATHLSEDVKMDLLQSQFDAQHSHYANNYTSADFGIIQYGNTAVGRIYLNRTVTEIHILEISLLAEFRSQGIGSAILAAVLEEARLTDRSVRLHVEKQSTAVGFYKKHGFCMIGEKPMHLEMSWQASIKDANS